MIKGFPYMKNAVNGEKLKIDNSASNSSASESESRIQRVLDDVYEKYKNIEDGEVATYIPELGKANPKHFGICLATVDGRVFSAGDCDKEFTIQSMCKPFAFQMKIGRAHV